MKKAAKVIVEKYFLNLTYDFQTNKKLCDDIAIIPTKRLRNKIAGYVTHLMRRIQRGPVRGISLKLQEEERERKMDFVPEVSYVDAEINKGIEVDEDVDNMLKAIGFGDLPQIIKQEKRPAPVKGRKSGKKFGDKKDRKPRGERKEKKAADQPAAAATETPATAAQ